MVNFHYKSTPLLDTDEWSISLSTTNWHITIAFYYRAMLQTSYRSPDGNVADFTITIGRHLGSNRTAPYPDLGYTGQ